MIDTEKHAFGSMTVDQISELLRINVLYLQANGLHVGLTMVVIDRGGIRTVGNLPPEAQGATFSILAERFSNPDSQEWIGLDGKPHAAH